MKCARHGCNDEATHIPRICVPAKDRSRFTPVRMAVNTPCCRKHCKQYEVGAWLECPTRDGKKKNRDLIIMLANGQAEPDFQRAYVESLSIGTLQAQAQQQAKWYAAAEQAKRGADQSISA